MVLRDSCERVIRLRTAAIPHRMWVEGDGGIAFNRMSKGLTQGNGESCVKKNGFTSVPGAKMMSSFSYLWERFVSLLKIHIILTFNCHFLLLSMPASLSPGI